MDDTTAAFINFFIVILNIIVTYYNFKTLKNTRS